MHLAFWLLPCERDRATLAGIITGLARRFGAPEFEPHVTLYAGPLGENDDADALLRTATAGIAPVTLQPLRIAASPVFTKTLFIEFPPSHELTLMHGRLTSRVEIPSGYVLHPHLSLLYAKLGGDVRSGLLQEADCPPQELRFDAVCAVVVPDRIETPADVRGWRVAVRRTLD